MNQPGKPPAYKYDRTASQRQAKRRALFSQMRNALHEIEGAKSLDEAKTIARIGRGEQNISENP